MIHLKHFSFPCFKKMRKTVDFRPVSQSRNPLKIKESRTNLLYHFLTLKESVFFFFHRFF